MSVFLLLQVASEAKNWYTFSMTETDPATFQQALSLADTLQAWAIETEGAGLHNHPLRGKVRRKIAAAAWRILLDRRTELDDKTWTILHEGFSVFCFREHSWYDSARDLAPALRPFPSHYHMAPRPVEDMVTELREKLEAGDPNPENLHLFAYEIDPLDVYLVDELPNRTVAEFLAAHPNTDSELLAQAGEEIPSQVYNLVNHPNYPADAITRSQYTPLLHHLIDTGNGARVFAALWEDDVYDWESVTAITREHYRLNPIARAIGSFGSEESIIEMLSIAKTETDLLRPLLEAILHRPEPLADITILAELLKLVAEKAFADYGNLNFIRIKELWMVMMGNRDTLSLEEVDLFLRFGVTHVPYPELLAEWMLDDGLLKTSMRTPSAEKAFSRLTKKYPPAVARIPDLSDILVSAVL